MIELTLIIAITVSIFSFLGMVIIFWRKIPALVELPEKDDTIKHNRIFNNLKTKLISIRYFQSLDFNIVLQKFLAKSRILILKLENKIFFWLQKLREGSQKKKLKNENYWQELKKNAKNKKNNSL